MKILGVITARANSTRLPNKNLKKIKNKSLIEITINFSKKLNILFDILVTSDSKKINDIAKKNKIKFVEKRPNGLSMKNTSSATTVINAIKWYEKKYEKIDSIILLQPTTPFRDIKFVNNCIEKFLKFKKPVISVHRLKKKNNVLSDGSVYIISKKDLFKSKSFMEKLSIKLESKSDKNSIDIDSFKDLEKARLLSNLN